LPIDHAPGELGKGAVLPGAAVTMARRDDIPSLTGLRGVAACSVMLAHAIDTSFIWNDVRVFDPYVLRLAWFGMSLFFVLRGFVIEYNYAELFQKLPLSAAAYRFYVARVARLYPLYIFSIFTTMPIFPHPNLNVVRTIVYLTMTQSWFNLEMAAFAPAWSISSEWFFYLAFIPLTFVVARLRRPMFALVATSITTFIGLAAIFYLWRAPLTGFLEIFRHDPWLGAEPSDWFYYFSPYVRVFEFIVGVLTARCFLAGKRGGPVPVTAHIVIGLALAWCAAVILVSRLTQNAALENIASNFAPAPAIAAVMLSVCRYDTWLTRLLSRPLALFLGEISYSIYIWSFVALMVVSGLLHHAEPSMAAYGNAFLRVVLICGLTIVFAYGSYHLIEVPSRRWIRVWGERLGRAVARKGETSPSDSGDTIEVATLRAVPNEP
jgi:peptidoglycan/LPS O-acetylase OafA/YrhL